MDKLVARKPLSFSLLSTLPELFIDKNIIFLDLSYTVSLYLMTRGLTAVRQVVNNLDSYVVVQELDLAMNLPLYGLLCHLLGNSCPLG